MAKRKLKGQIQAELTQVQEIIKTKDFLLNEQDKEIQKLKRDIESRDSKYKNLEAATIGLMGDYHLAASELLRATAFKGLKFSLPKDNPVNFTISALLTSLGGDLSSHWKSVDE